MRLRLLLVVVALGLALAAAAAFRPALPPAERGRRLALRMGCFGCHTAEGVRGAANPGRTDRTVPNFEGDVMMFAKTRDELREWIRDGVPASKANSQSWREQRARGTLRMPAFRRRLGARAIDDLASYVEAMSGEPAPEDSLAKRGCDRSEALGCSGCHGPGGRLARPNPGSLRGYVPSWDGRDFAELVTSRAEFGQWVERGVSRRFEANPAARFFLRRAVLQMPAYERHLEPGDVDALWAYVQWLRGSKGTAGEP